MFKLFLLLSIIVSILSSHEKYSLQISNYYHTEPIRKIIKSINNEVITVSEDKTIKIWDMDTFTLKRTIYGEIGNGWSGRNNLASYNNKNLLAVSGDFAEDQTNYEMYKTRIFDINSGQLIKLLDTTDGLVRDLLFTSDNKYLIVGHSYPQYTFTIWDTTNWKKINLLRLPSRISDFKKNKYYTIEKVKEIEYKNEKCLLLVSNYGDMDIYSFKNQSIIFSKNIGAAISDVQVTKKNIFVASFEKIFIYDLDVNFHNEIAIDQQINFLKVSPNNNLLVACTAKECLLYEINKNNLENKKTLIKSNNTVMDLIFIDNKNVYISGGQKHDLSLLNIPSLKIVKKFRNRNNGIYSIGINENIIGFSNQYLEEENLIDTNFNHYIDLLKVIKINSLMRPYFQENLNKNDLNISIEEDNASKQFGRTTRLLIYQDNNFMCSINRDASNGFEHDSYGILNSRKILVSGGAYGFLEGYDLHTCKKNIEFIGHHSYVSGLTQNQNWLISSGYDGIINIWALKDINNFKSQKVISKKIVSILEKKYGLSRQAIIDNRDKLYNNYNIDIYENEILQKKPLASIYVDKNGEFVIWTEEGYFTVSSPEALKYITWHMNRGYDKEAYRYDLSKFYDVFFRPDLVKLKLDGKDISQYTGGLTAQDALKNPPPSVTLTAMEDATHHAINSNRDDANITTKQSNVKVRFKVNDEGGGVGAIRIYQEGKLIKTIGSDAIKKVIADADVKSDQQEYEESKKTVVALAKSVNKEDLTFDDRIGKVKSESTNNQPGNYEVDVELKRGQNTISIEAFNSTNTITSFQSNIQINADIPKQPSKLYAIVAGVNQFEAPFVSNLRYAVNDAKAISDEIKKAKNWIYDDVEVVYLTDKEVTRQSVQQAFEKIQQKASVNDTIIFYMSSHGLSANGTFYLFPSNNMNVKEFIDFNELFTMSAKTKALNQIFLVDACQSGGALDIAASVYDSRASVLARSAGIHLLSASTSGTNAFENDEAQHGAFTYQILKALKEKQNDTNKDGFISVIEISEVLKSKQQDQSKDQFPVIRNVGNDVMIEKYLLSDPKK